MAREKTNTSFKVNKYYADESDMKSSSIKLSLDKLRYGLIKHGDVVSISIDGEKLDINGSWIGLILLMIETYYNNQKPLIDAGQVNFIINLVKGKVISKGLDVSNTYGIYDNEKPYVAYKIVNTPYWLETNMETSSIFQAIVGLSKLLNIKYTSLEFSIVKKGEEYKEEIELNKFELEVKEEWTNVNNLDTELKNCIKITKIDLFGEVVNITSLFEGITRLVELIFKVYKMDALEYIIGNDGIGITTYKELPGYTIHKIENLDYSELIDGEDIKDKDKLILYTNNSVDKQIEFLKDLCENLDTIDDIKIAIIKMIPTRVQV